MTTKTPIQPSRLQFIALLFAAVALTSCTIMPKPGTMAPRKGDEIVVAGQLVHTGTRVVLWMDPHGYDAYRVERRFGSFQRSLALPQGVEADKIQAGYEDGVLTVTVPKAEEQKPKRIEVKAKKTVEAGAGQTA